MSADSQRTRPSLLLRVRDPHDTAAWGQFVEVYAPLIQRYCRKHDLQEADAADVCQEVLRAFARNVERFDYDPERGRFRSWLLTVTLNKIRNFIAHRQRLPEPVSATKLEQAMEFQPTSAELSDWDSEYHRQVFEWAAARVRREFKERSWDAFWMTTLDQLDGKEVAKRLGLSLGAVYVAKSRVLARLREEIHTVDDDVPALREIST